MAMNFLSYLFQNSTQDPANERVSLDTQQKDKPKYYKFVCFGKKDGELCVLSMIRKDGDGGFTLPSGAPKMVRGQLQTPEQVCQQLLDPACRVVQQLKYGAGNAYVVELPYWTGKIIGPEKRRVPFETIPSDMAVDTQQMVSAFSLHRAFDYIDLDEDINLIESATRVYQ